MPIRIIIILTALCTFVITGIIISCVLPEERISKFGEFRLFLHNLFNFKNLLIAKILKFSYILATVCSVALGFFLLFWVEKIDLAENSQSYYIGVNGWEWKGYYGLIILIIAPITIRIVFETAMLMILLVQNVIEINNKIKIPQNQINNTQEVAQDQTNNTQNVSKNQNNPEKIAPYRGENKDCNTSTQNSGNIYYRGQLVDGHHEIINSENNPNTSNQNSGNISSQAQHQLMDDYYEFLRTKKK